MYYTLNELALKWSRTEDELIQWGATGKTFFQIPFSGYLGREAHIGRMEVLTDGKYLFLDELLTLETAIIQEIRTLGEATLYIMVSGYVFLPIDPPNAPKANPTATLVFQNGKVHPATHRADAKVTRNDLVMSANTVKDMELKHPELLFHGGDQEEKQPGNQTHETDIDMVKRLTPVGVNLESNDKNDDELRMKIGEKLKDAFPKITPHRAGKLLSNPNDDISPGGFQKRGRKYLGLKPGKKKKIN